MKNYDEATVLRELKRNRSIKISGTIIKVPKDSTDVGIRTYGKIDYLVNYCGYKLIMIDNILPVGKDNDTERKSRKPKAKERFSLAKSVKKAMK